MNGLVFIDEVGIVGMNQQRRPLPARDLPVPRTQLRTWTDYLEPAGLGAGVWAGLFHPDGRQLGLLTMHTAGRDEPTDATCRFLGLLAPAITNAVDPMRAVATVAQMVAGALAGVVLTRPGRAVPLPGLPAHRLIDDGSAVLAAVGRQLRDGPGRISFLCPDPNDSGRDDHQRITALVCAPEHPGQVATVVVISPPGEMYKLTGRELEILGFVIEGWPNNRIAGDLFITERTVAAHVEHILAKLGVANRTVAAVQALRWGLYIPRGLIGPPPSRSHRRGESRRRGRIAGGFGSGRNRVVSRSLR
jgi:DNA-binding CsgD family transcriptional regulator